MPPTTRERVLDLISNGYTVRQISTLLGISTQAVYKQLAKAGVATPTEGEQT